MGWPQPSSTVQTDNSTAEGVVNNNIAPQKLNLWIYNFTGYAVEKHKVSYNITEPHVYSTGETTVPNIIYQIITNAIVQYIPGYNINHLSPIWLFLEKWTQNFILRFQQGCIVNLLHIRYTCNILILFFPVLTSENKLILQQ